MADGIPSSQVSVRVLALIGDQRYLHPPAPSRAAGAYLASLGDENLGHGAGVCATRPKEAQALQSFYIAVGSASRQAARASCVSWGACIIIRCPLIWLAHGLRAKSIGDTRSGPTARAPVPCRYFAVGSFWPDGTGWDWLDAGHGGRAAGCEWPGWQADSEPCVAGIAVLGAALDGFRKPWVLGCGGVDATATQFGPASHLANQRLRAQEPPLHNGKHKHKHKHGLIDQPASASDSKPASLLSQSRPSQRLVERRTSPPAAAPNPSISLPASQV
ncbi:hypothetical protein N5P37_010424 [Trichoderma harzianum]|nr:hypothetical protein N5P37_010424 [Trichoderma harzianum]